VTIVDGQVALPVIVCAIAISVRRRVGLARLQAIAAEDWHALEHRAPNVTNELWRKGEFVTLQSPVGGCVLMIRTTPPSFVTPTRATGTRLIARQPRTRFRLNASRHQGAPEVNSRRCADSAE